MDLVWLAVTAAVWIVSTAAWVRARRLGAPRKHQVEA